LHANPPGRNTQQPPCSDTWREKHDTQPNRGKPANNAHGGPVKKDNTKWRSGLVYLTEGPAEASAAAASAAAAARSPAASLFFFIRSTIAASAFIRSPMPLLPILLAGVPLHRTRLSTPPHPRHWDQAVQRATTLRAGWIGCPRSKAHRGSGRARRKQKAKGNGRIRGKKGMLVSIKDKALKIKQVTTGGTYQSTWIHLPQGPKRIPYTFNVCCEFARSLVHRPG